VNPLRVTGHPVAIGHRGAAAVAPENTMAAFQAAWDAGSVWVETDVQPTLDSVPVLLHDTNLDRTTDGTGPIRAQTAHSVAALDAGSWFGPEFVGARVPELSDLLGILTGDRRLLLELKGAFTVRQLETVIETLRTARLDDRVYLQSFEVEVLRLVRDLLPNEPFGLLVEQVGEDPIGTCQKLGATAYNPDFKEVLVHPGIVEELHGADIAVMVWTPDVPGDWARLTHLGVDAIITDDPTSLLAWQARR
jgi:glycerophosphoryl diester phosphodiesterase